MGSKPGRTFIALVTGFIAFAIGACEKETPQSEISAAPELSGKPPLTVGVLPATAGDAIRADYEALASEIGRILNRRVELEVAPDYDALVSSLVSGRAHLAQLSAYLYVRVKASVRNAEVLVQQRMAWDTEYRGVFVVKADSPFKGLESLGKKRLAYVDKHSSAGFFYPRMRLRALGLDPDNHFAATPFAGSHKKVAEMVTSGQVEVGVISEQTLSEFLNLRVIDKTDVIPDDAILATTNPAYLSAGELDELRAFFLRAHTEPKMNAFMNRRGVETYVSPNLDVYLPLEQEMGLSTTVKAGGEAPSP